LNKQRSMCVLIGNLNITLVAIPYTSWTRSLGPEPWYTIKLYLEYGHWHWQLLVMLLDDKCMLLIWNTKMKRTLTTWLEVMFKMQCMCKNSFSKVRTDLALFSLFDLLCKINDRENRRANHEWTIQRNWQHCMHKTKTNSTKKTQHDMCWIPFYANIHK